MGKSVAIVLDVLGRVSGGGKLAPKSPAAVGDSGGPFRVAVSSDGSSVYVTNFPRQSESPTTVSQFNVGLGGKLSPKSPAKVGAGIGPEGVAAATKERSRGRFLSPFCAH